MKDQQASARVPVTREQAVKFGQRVKARAKARAALVVKDMARTMRRSREDAVTPVGSLRVLQALRAVRTARKSELRGTR